MRRLIGFLIMAVGVIVGVLGILSGTLWKPATKVTATTTAITTPAIVIGSNEREMVDGDVTITIAPLAGTKFYVVGAQPQDLAQWLGENAYQKVVGLQDWHTLELELHGEGDLPQPQGSDLWRTELESTAELTITGDELTAFRNLDMLVIGDGVSRAPTVTLTWPRQVSAPFLWPGVALGALLLVVGILVVVDDARQRQRQRRREERRKRRQQRLEQLEAQTVVIPKVQVEQEPAAQSVAADSVTTNSEPPTNSAADSTPAPTHQGEGEDQE